MNNSERLGIVGVVMGDCAVDYAIQTGKYTNPDGTPLSEEANKKVIQYSAMDMCSGYHLMKNKCLLIGAGLGFGAAVVLYSSYKIVKKVKEDKES